MRKTVQSLLVVFISLVFGSQALAQVQASLEEQMTGTEFERAGLEKLTPEELRFLNDWLENNRLPRAADPEPDGEANVVADAAAATRDRQSLRTTSAADPDTGFELRRKRSTVSSRIAGTFDGWSGKTDFTLENGMVWRQAESGRYGVRTLDSPEVRIEPKLGGSWRLYVEGLNRSLKVRRIK